MKIVYSRRALTQLDEILKYIRAYDPTAALKVNARIKRAIDRLAHHPYSARASNVPGVRVLTITRHPYIVYYAVN